MFCFPFSFLPPFSFCVPLYFSQQSRLEFSFCSSELDSTKDSMDLDAEYMKLGSYLLCVEVMSVMMLMPQRMIFQEAEVLRIGKGLGVV